MITLITSIATCIKYDMFGLTVNLIKSSW